MLASTCSIRLATLATVKFLSRLLTALNLLPSMATTARVNKLNCRHSCKNCAQAARIAGPLPCRNSAMVLKHGPQRPAIAIGLPLKPPARLDAVEIAVNVELEQVARRIARTSRRLRLDPRKSS